MKRRLIAFALATVLCMSSAMTAFAASSSTESNSSSQEDTSSGSSSSSSSTSTSSSASKATASNPQPVQTVVAKTAPGAVIKPEVVQVAVASPTGTVSAVKLSTVITQKQAEVVNAVQSIAAVLVTVSAPTATQAEKGAASAQVVQQVSALLTTAASPVFTQTVQALAETKGSSMVVNNCGTVKTKATAKDALGNTIASAGTIKHVTSGALIMLMSVNADGTIEYVEGVVDPVTGAVMGAFQGTPSVITVLVLA